MNFAKSRLPNEDRSRKEIATGRDYPQTIFEETDGIVEQEYAEDVRELRQHTENAVRTEASK